MHSARHSQQPGICGMIAALPSNLQLTSTLRSVPTEAIAQASTRQYKLTGEITSVSLPNKTFLLVLTTKVPGTERSNTVSHAFLAGSTMDLKAEVTIEAPVSVTSRLQTLIENARDTQYSTTTSLDDQQQEGPRFDTCYAVQGLTTSKVRSVPTEGPTTFRNIIDSLTKTLTAQGRPIRRHCVSDRL